MLIKKLLDLILPPVCPSCGCNIDALNTLCGKCWSAIPFITKPYCARLGIPFELDLGEGTLSPQAIAQPPSFQRCRAVARYEGPARDLVHNLKYGDQLDVSTLMGQWMANTGDELIAQNDLIVPMPLHTFRLWRRRYNQAKILSEEVAKISQLPLLSGVLQRIRATRPQVGQTRRQRLSNVQGAFNVAPEKHHLLENKRVLLIDDVLTTGASANAATRALEKAGARSVDVLVFAITTKA